MDSDPRTSRLARWCLRQETQSRRTDSQGVRRALVKGAGKALASRRGMPPVMRRLILAPLCVSTLAVAEGRWTDDQTSVMPEAAAFSLADAIAFAQQHSPRLRSARATIERARGQEQAAFAPFLPEIDLLFQSGATSNNQGPGATGPTGFILASSTPGTHGYVQTELQLLWTLYDFGRRAGRHNQAAARERIAKLQLVRADQTVQFDVTAAYLNILLARASRLVQEDAI